MFAENPIKCVTKINLISVDRTKRILENYLDNILKINLKNRNKHYGAEFYPGSQEQAENNIIGLPRPFLFFVNLSTKPASSNRTRQS